MRSISALAAYTMFLAACGSDNSDDDAGGNGSPSGDSSWSAWGYDDDNSRANPNENTLGVSNVADLEVQWSVDGPGVTCTPLVVGGTVYYANWFGEVVAASSSDGRELWSTSIDNGAPVSASLALADDRVFGSSGNEVFALDQASGSIAWRATLDDHPATLQFSTPVPIRGTDLLVIGVAGIELTEQKDDYSFRGSVVALKRSSGEEAWRVYTSQDDETSGAGVSVWSSAAVDYELGRVFIGTGNTYEDPASPLSDAMLAIDFASGNLEWSRQFTDGDVYTVLAPAPKGPDADVGAAPNLFEIDGTPVVGVGDKAGVYSVLRRSDGTTVWATQVSPGWELGGIMTAAAYHDGVVYVTGNEWGATGIAVLPDFFDPLNKSAAVALDARTGDVLWETPLEAPSFGGVAIAGGVVYATLTEGQIVGLDASDGTLLWSHTPGTEMGGGAAIADGQVFVGYGFSLFKAPSEITGGLTAYGLP